MAASLSSCSRSNYAFNNTVPAYLGSERVHETAATPAATKAEASSPTSIAAPSKAVAVKTVPTQIAPSVVAVPTIATVPAAKATKPSLVQRLALKSVVKQLNKMHQKQTTAGTEKTASKKGNAALIALAGLLLAILGLIVVGGSGLGGSGAGVAIGAILFYVGFIAFIVGLVLLVVHLVNGD
ncbi:hypothetical protein [Hymenobacter baengnokdamensis]|uniref:hypothetical protein n=1 Tax=Hymenobacter baengnokdamensis TaxID=2615203 RepID=UPI001245F1D7|nr:hypothetical protein [Hymenobacter baengnokdamensis]